MIDLLAALGVAVCLVFMLRIVMPERWRWRIDAAWARLLARLKRRRPKPAPRKPLSEQEAARLAEEAIRRAREGRAKAESGRWEGNVFKLRGKRGRKPH